MTIMINSEDPTKLSDLLRQTLDEDGERVLNKRIVRHKGGWSIKNESDEIIAGCTCHTVLEVVWIDRFWVHSDYRRQGLGKKLMDRILDFGRQHGSRTVIVPTMDFQDGKYFYESVGFRAVAEFDGFADNHYVTYLIKKL